AGPVMEIFVSYHPIEEHEVGIGGGVRARKDVFGIEYVESLVLHCSHVEVADRDDHVLVQIQLQSKYFLVPFHCTLQCLHGETALVEFARLDKHGERNAAARLCLEE